MRVPNKSFLSAFFIFIICSLLLVSFSLAQEIRIDTIKITKTRNIRIVTLMTVPKFIIQLSLSYNWGAMELSAHNGGFSRDDFKRGKSYCARNGYGISLTGKLPLNKKGQFWLDIITSFNRFQSDLIAKNTEEGEVSYNVFSGGTGVEYNFTSYHHLKYFAGGNLLLSAISGNAELVVPDSTAKYQVKISSSLRMGYSVFIGLEYAFDKSSVFNLGVKFTHANLLLKKFTQSTDSSQTDLNDLGANTPQLYTGWKQFAYATVFAGFSYYFGVRELRYKLP